MANSGSNSGGGGGAGGIMAGKAFVELYVKNNLVAGLNKARDDMDAFGRRIARTGAALVGVGAAAAAGFGAAATRTLNDLAKQGAIADAFGLTAEQFSGIAGVAKTAGEDVREFTESLVTLGKLATDAANGTEDASKAFAAMGLNAQSFLKVRIDEKFFKIFEAINKVSDPGERVRLLMKAFGEDGGKYLLPLLSKTPDQLRAMAKAFEISSRDTKAATEASAAYSEAGAEIKKVWDSVAITFAPVAKSIAEAIRSASSSLNAYVKENQNFVIGAGVAVAGVTALGVGMVAVGPAIMGVTGAWTLMTGVVSTGAAVMGGVTSALLSPIVAIAAGGVAWLAFTDKGRSAMGGIAGAVQDSLQPTLDNLKAGWSSVVKAVGRGDFASAFKVGTAALKVEWVRLTNFMEKTWADLNSKLQIQWTASSSVISGVLEKLGKKFGFIIQPPPAPPGDRLQQGGNKPQTIVAPKRQGVAEKFGENFLAGFLAGPAVFWRENVVPKLGGVIADAQGGLGDVADKAADDIAKNAKQAADAAKKAEAERAKKLKEAEDKAAVARFIPKVQGQVADLSKWLGGGWSEAKRLLTPDNFPVDVQEKMAGIRGVFGGDAFQGIFGNGSGPMQQLADKAGKTNNLLSDILNAITRQGIGVNPETGLLMFTSGK
ncbi:phage tail tape measure protein [Limnoglobus roseus]|uniref:Phage tail tape measure protein n=1 Tax=Limnoglobus roseus TaxID=2598579 RepID=A0A5C1A820_9BACT|nr:hypothetical protein [Limnoglobus roseus]QEL14645.1 hypothetical protein PX52LOC_01538 [Limnoglobus roseus]